MEKYAVCFPVA